MPRHPDRSGPYINTLAIATAYYALFVLGVLIRRVHRYFYTWESTLPSEAFPGVPRRAISKPTLSHTAEIPKTKNSYIDRFLPLRNCMCRSTNTDHPTREPGQVSAKAVQPLPEEEGARALRP